MSDKKDFHLLRSVADFEDEQVTTTLDNKVVVSEAGINRDIGPFRKGERIEFLHLDLSGSVLQEVDVNGVIHREVEVGLREAVREIVK